MDDSGTIWVVGWTRQTTPCSTSAYCPVPFSFFTSKILQLTSQLRRAVTISKPQEWLLVYLIQKRKPGLNQVSETIYFRLREFPSLQVENVDYPAGPHFKCQRTAFRNIFSRATAFVASRGGCSSNVKSKLQLGKKD